MPRYVILRHEMPPATGRESHWDLMFEAGETLRTWAVEAEPFSQVSQPGRQLPEHRLAYLEYEGPVSGDRGAVTRWDAGEYQVEHEAEGRWRLTLRGGRIEGQLEFVPPPADDHFWIVSFVRASRKE